MKIVTSNTEGRMLELLKGIKGDPGDNYAIHFYLSGLQEHHKSEFQLKIAINILNDLFRESDGTIFAAGDGDLFVMYHGHNRGLLEKAVFQLRYLFVDDPLANHDDGSENEDFCDIYDLTFQWRPFHRVCMDRLAEVAQDEHETYTPKETTITPRGLAEIQQDLKNVDISLALRTQPVCAAKKDERLKPLYNEIYTNIAHLQKLVNVDFKLTGDRWLFKYLTEILDVFLIDTLKRRPKAFLEHPVSLNLNVKTVLSDMFMEFHKKIHAEIPAASVIIEIDIADVFADMKAFLAAKDLAQKHGYRICLDGLDDISFKQVDRNSLGFDLAKLQWNADMKGDLHTEKNLHLAEAIRKCGYNRIILCRCDSVHAIEYGQALGVSLFQGRYPDRILDPDAKVVN